MSGLHTDSCDVRVLLPAVTLAPVMGCVVAACRPTCWAPSAAFSGVNPVDRVVSKLGQGWVNPVESDGSQWQPLAVHPKHKWPLRLTASAQPVSPPTRACGHWWILGQGHAALGHVKGAAPTAMDTAPSPTVARKDTTMMHDDDRRRKTLPVLPTITVVLACLRLLLDFIRTIR